MDQHRSPDSYRRSQSPHLDCPPLWCLSRTCARGHTCGRGRWANTSVSRFDCVNSANLGGGAICEDAIGR
eukprot:scaffold2740_cov418-Prasinococcus_capsulatus_cf.AAC.26